MGLDIYAGTLTRYYTRNWKTVVQQFRERNGFNFKVVRQGENGDGEETASPEDVFAGVNQWRQRIISGTGASSDIKWNEDYDETPYFTDKPDWDAYNALRLMLVLKSQGLPVPEKVAKNFNPEDIEGFNEAYEKVKGNSAIIDGCEFFVPLTDPFGFHYVTPVMNEADIYTTAMLLFELDEANQHIWGADRDTILEWTTTEGYGTDGVVTTDENGNQIHMIEEITEYNTESLAKFAFSILFKACEFSLKNGVCIVLDY